MAGKNKKSKKSQAGKPEKQQSPTNASSPSKGSDSSLNAQNSSPKAAASKAVASKAVAAAKKADKSSPESAEPKKNESKKNEQSTKLVEKSEVATPVKASSKQASTKNKTKVKPVSTASKKKPTGKPAGADEKLPESKVAVEVKSSKKAAPPEKKATVVQTPPSVTESAVTAEKPSKAAKKAAQVEPSASAVQPAKKENTPGKPELPAKPGRKKRASKLETQAQMPFEGDEQLAPENVESESAELAPETVDASDASEQTEKSSGSAELEATAEASVSSDSVEEGAEGDGETENSYEELAPWANLGNLPLEPELSEEEARENFLLGAIEALLFASEKPLSLKDIARNIEVDKKRCKELLATLWLRYRGRGILPQQISGGFCFRTSGAYSDYVQRLLSLKPVRLSRAQVETLSVIAYRQPITRPEVDEIRGVDSGQVIKGLLERELIKIVGKKEEPGRPMLYGTTPQFMEFFGLDSLRDLPPLKEFTELSDDSKAVYAKELGEEVPEMSATDEDSESDSEIGEVASENEEVIAESQDSTSSAESEESAESSTAEGSDEPSGAEPSAAESGDEPSGAEPSVAESGDGEAELEEETELEP